tara:strand:- start:697 stop:1317 length:621 start_codon:yes stop_codon:yes gene_type:complete
MVDRKKKLRFVQISLLLIGVIIVLFTYLQKNKNIEPSIISKETKIIINDSLLKKNENNSDVFYDISYNGIDLAGNRYILKSKEAKNLKSQPETVYMKEVNAIFYFKDETILKIQSKKAIYNNKTLDIKFEGSVDARYEGSKLLAEKAEYSNSKSFLKISDNVKIQDVRGEIFADNLFFNLKNQTLDISSFDNKKVNANININEKKF